MNNFTMTIHPAYGGGFWATCAEIPGVNGQGETREEAERRLQEAIRLILGDRWETLIDDPVSRPRLDAFLRQSADERSYAFDPRRL